MQSYLFGRLNQDYFFLFIKMICKFLFIKWIELIESIRLIEYIGLIELIVYWLSELLGIRWVRFITIQLWELFWIGRIYQYKSCDCGMNRGRGNYLFYTGVIIYGSQFQNNGRSFENLFKSLRSNYSNFYTFA